MEEGDSLTARRALANSRELQEISGSQSARIAQLERRATELERQFRLVLKRLGELENKHHHHLPEKLVKGFSIGNITGEACSKPTEKLPDLAK